MNAYMGFVGVSTGASSINRVFPLWADILGLPTRELVGHDVALDAPDEVYRDLVRRIAADPDHLGALVTTHKIRMYDAAADLFDELDTFAQACGEISSISKVDGRLVGHAKDPLTVGLALDDLLPRDHFAGGPDGAPHVLVLGAGGSGTALAWHLGQREDRPGAVVVTDTSPERLRHLEAVLARGDRRADVVTSLVADPAATAALAARLPEGSLVVNATGLGKDRPGSPLADGTAFPRHGFAWEFNYRGSLEFLRQARDRADVDEITVVDGWRYFIHGWTQVMAEVFHLDLAPELVEKLADAAGAVR
jgi:shikimate 5-dehydrogenase